MMQIWEASEGNHGDKKPPGCINGKPGVKESPVEWEMSRCSGRSFIRQPDGRSHPS
jgi:hypothetical protein